jgi:hypothetical protein
VFEGPEEELDPQHGPAHEGQAYLGKSEDERHPKVVGHETGVGEGDGEVVGEVVGEVASEDVDEGEDGGTHVSELRCVMMGQPVDCSPKTWHLRVILV